MPEGPGEGAIGNIAIKKILIGVSSRSEAIKLAAVIWECKARPEFRTRVLALGPHLPVVLETLRTFKIEPDLQVELSSIPQSLSLLTAEALTKMDPLIARENPDLVVVAGHSACAAALALSAFYHKTAVAGVGAGIRTSDKFLPFPDETVRRVLTPLTDLHFVSSDETRNRLKKEGVAVDRIFRVGPTGLDALKKTLLLLHSNEALLEKSLQSILDETKGHNVLITFHRRDSVGPRYEQVLNALRDISCEFSNKRFIFPVDSVQSIHSQVFKALQSLPNVYLLDPLDYPSMVAVMRQSQVVISDSVGIQDECAFLKVPLLIIKDSTEPLDCVKTGFAKIIGCQYEKTKIELKKALAETSWKDSLQNLPSPIEGEHPSASLVEQLLQTRQKLW